MLPFPAEIHKLAKAPEIAHLTAKASLTESEDNLINERKKAILEQLVGTENSLEHSRMLCRPNHDYGHSSVNGG